MTDFLSSIRVLDLSRFIAGPTCTQFLADLGATVYKIERPGTGDEIRGVGPFPRADDPRGLKGDSGAYLAWNRGKQSVTVDLSKPEGARLVRDLAARCDVVVENYKVGALARYGLDYKSLAAAQPALIYCSLTGYGQEGPDAPKPAFDGAMQGRAGLMSVAGPPEGSPGSAPMRTPVNLIDVSAGLIAAIGILGALWHRKETGKGQAIDASLLDTAVFLNSQFNIGYLLNGIVTQRAGNRNPGTCPSEAFKTKDGYALLICATDTQWTSFCREVGQPQWAEDPRFRNNAERLRHMGELYPMLNELFASRTTAEMVAIIERASVPGGPINDIGQVFRDPQVVHRGLAMELTRANGQTVPVLRSPLRFSDSEVDHRPPPTVGEHTEKVLREVLGKSADEVAKLKSAGAI
jgi:crotonobetainyl-CoA:carnitine CoA-transferase CaiB-like acyl-CoA transferase